VITLVPPRSTKNLLERASAAYQSQLVGSPGESHLLERGITKETIERFRLGFVDSPLLGDERFYGRISIPYQTVTGIVSIRFRVTTATKTETTKKYLSSAGDPGRPFNVQSLDRINKICYLTEGEMDAIILDQMGLTSIGIPGAQAWNPIFGRILRHRNVVLLADGDKAGRELADTVGKQTRIKVVSMPADEDVNSMYLNLGADKFLEWITTE